MTDFTQYVPPGVYIQDTTTPLVNTSGVEATAVCLIGASVGYQTYTELITLLWDGAGSPPAGIAVPLTQRGAYLSSISGGTAHSNGAIAAPVITKVSDGTVLVEGTDYSLSLDTTGGDGVANGIASVTALSSSLSGIQVKVIYNYANSAYASPQLFTNYDDLAAVYGPPLVGSVPGSPTATQVISPLSLAAKVAFENGSTQIITVALDPTISDFRTAFQDAYAKIETDFRVGTVVPVLTEVTPTSATTALSSVTNLALDLEAHCDLATSEGFPRIGIFGTTSGLQNQAANGFAGVADFAALSASVANKRVMQAYPNVMTVYNGSINMSAEVDGAYLAAAYAGMFSATGVSESLTRETVKSFTGIPARVQKLQTKTYKNSLSKAGIAVTEISRQNVLVCRHGVSTDMTSTLTREMSITRQSDALYLLLQDGLDAAGLVGSPITLDTVLNVKGVVVGILENAKNNQIIVDYQDAMVRQQALPGGDPTAIEVKFAWLPAVPLNYVVVAYSIDLNTGDYSDITSSIDAQTAASTGT